MSKNSTDPGIGAPLEHLGDTVKEPVRIEADTTPMADTIVDAPVDAPVEPLVARYRTDPRAPATPEMAMLRGIRGQKRGGLVGFRDGLEDVRKGSVVQAERDAALARLAEEGKAPSQERTQPMGEVQPAPRADSKAIKQLIGLAVVVVVIGIAVLVAIRLSTQEPPTTHPSAQPSTSTSVKAITTAGPSPVPTPATPSASATSNTHGAPEAPTAKSLPSVPSTTKPEPKPSTPPPTTPTVSAKPTSAPTAVPTVFDPTQGT
jgi:hypothetical protein